MIPTGTNLDVKNIPRATITLIVANVVVFIWEPLLIELLGRRIDVLTYGTGNVSLIGLFTSIFLHADLFHIVFNMLFLWVFGPPLEDRVGKKLFFVYYLAAGVAANLFEVLVDFVHNPDSHLMGIGASGAISGIMGLYLYRCYYSRMKIVVSPLWLPINIQIPAAPLLILWFFRDVLAGWASFSHPSNVANWAHVGGFLFGLAVGRIKKYGQEGATEHYTEKVLEKIRAGGGWKEAGTEKELLKLLKLSPNDPDIHLELGHYYRETYKNEEAKSFYQTAIHKFFLTKPLYGAYAVLDYLEAFGKPVSVQHHLRAAEILVQNGDLEEAGKVLEPVLSAAEPRAVAERILATYVKLCRALGKEELDRALAEFRRLYPESRFKKEIEQALRRKPEDIFPKPASAVSRPEREAGPEEEPEEKPRERKILLLFHRLISLVVDPLFLFLWIITFIFGTVYFAFAGILSEKQMLLQILSFFLAFVAAAFYRLDWSELRKDLTIDEDAARLAADTATELNRAYLAERGENYARAAELYEKVLLHDASNIQARFSLAKIYLEKLNDRNNGLRQLQKLLNTAPAGHPYHDYAKEGIGVKS